MDVSLFDFELPEELIAQVPLMNRTESRLLTLDKRSGEVQHRQFSDLSGLLRPGDVLVMNDTKVLPARLFGRKPDTGASVEVLLLKQTEGDRWEALVKPGKRCRTGTVIAFGEEESTGEPLLTGTIEAEGEMGERTIRFAYQGIFTELLDRLGHMPLPPYIKETLSDKDRYQTVYAREAGSAAAPTAGLHFTKNYLQQLSERGVLLRYVTLHVGLGTFRPVSADRVEEHRMHAEYYQVPEDTATAIAAAKAEGRRVIAIGTTSARTLETAAARSDSGIPEADRGWTDIFIYPGYQFRCVDAMLTNFHLPKSTLIMMISALAGREQVLHAYREAVERKYRFFSFGDAMFIY